MAGAWVMAFNRSDVRRKDIEAMGALLAVGDALDPASIDKALATTEFDVMVSTVGGTPQDPTADSQGNINLIEAAEKAGVKKLVLVTSVGVGDSKEAAPPQVRVVVVVAVMIVWLDYTPLLGLESGLQDPRARFDRKGQG